MTNTELRLHLYFATENDTAVILIRAARRLHRLVGWYRDTRLCGTPGLQPVTRGEVTKDCRTGLRLLNGQPAPLTKAERDVLLDGKTPPDAKLSDRYDTMSGGLHHRHSDGSLTLIRDFRGMEFEPIKTPYDDRRDTVDAKASWHPADGERA